MRIEVVQSEAVKRRCRGLRRRFFDGLATQGRIRAKYGSTVQMELEIHGRFSRGKAESQCVRREARLGNFGGCPPLETLPGGSAVKAAESHGARHGATPFLLRNSPSPRAAVPPNGRSALSSPSIK